MAHPIPRRAALTSLALTCLALPTSLRAQGVPIVPQIIPPPTPAPNRPPAPPVTAIDKTKIYYLFFDQAIDVASMRALRRQLALLVEAGVSNIVLTIDSPGGLVEPTLITYSFIRALAAKIDTHAQGFVQSAATLLFLAGEARSADRDARFLFHPQSSSAPVGAVGEQQIVERLLSFRAVADVAAEIYHDRTSLDQAEIDRFSREAVIYTAAQAQAVGIIQSVADLKIPGEGAAKILFLD